MTPKKGKRGRKTIRSIKRERYNKSFVRRYGMTREDFRELKKSDPQAAHALRIKAV